MILIWLYHRLQNSIHIIHSRHTSSYTPYDYARSILHYLSLDLYLCVTPTSHTRWHALFYCSVASQTLLRNYLCCLPNSRQQNALRASHPARYTRLRCFGMLSAMPTAPLPPPLVKMSMTKQLQGQSGKPAVRLACETNAGIHVYYSFIANELSYCVVKCAKVLEA